MTAAPETWFRGDGAVRATTVRTEGERALGTVDGRPIEGRVRAAGEGAFVLEVGGVRHVVAFARRGDRLLLSFDGRALDLALVDPAVAAGGGGAAEPFAVSPMAGVVTKVHVKAGETVGKGAPLFAVEAMKMEYVVKADRDVRVAEVKVVAGARVALNEPGVRFVEEASS